MNTDVLSAFETDYQFVARQLSKYFVGLAWVDRLKTPTPAATEDQSVGLRHGIQSAFVIEIGGHWYFATAGHIIRDMQRSWADDRKPLRSCLCAGYHHTPRRIVEFPFDIDPSQWGFIVDDHEGHDYAVRRVSSMYREWLTQEGVEAVDESMIGHIGSTYEFSVVSGIPRQFSERSTTPYHDGITLNTQYHLLHLPLVAPTTIPECLNKAKPLYYGAIPDLSITSNGQPNTLEDVVGMSGGPVFGFDKVDSGFQYQLIAIQSMWAPKSRVLAACYLAPLVNMLRAAAEKARSK